MQDSNLFVERGELSGKKENHHRTPERLGRIVRPAGNQVVERYTVVAVCGTCDGFTDDPAVVAAQL